ncbi:hypothetical protein QTN25_007764 [Entamoeba marina]
MDYTMSSQNSQPFYSSQMSFSQPTQLLTQSQFDSQSSVMERNYSTVRPSLLLARSQLEQKQKEKEKRKEMKKGMITSASNGVVDLNRKMIKKTRN